MRLLDRYLLRELLLPLGYCLAGFLLFWISFDLVSEMEDYQRHHLGALDMAQFYLVRLPELLVVILPIALLLALLYALTHHARHHELVAIRAAGVSMWRLAAPYLVVGAAFSLGLFYLNECWVPASADLADQILNRYESAPAEKGGHRLDFRNDQARHTWQIQSYDPKTQVMLAPQVEWERPDGSIRRVIAQRADWTGVAWAFSNVQFSLEMGTNVAAATITQTNLLILAEFSETPESIQSEIKVNRLNVISAAKKPQLSIAEIQNYFRWHDHLSADKAALLHTQLQGRLAEPWTCLVVVLVALPFGAASGRRNVFVGVANSIFLCFAYFVLLRLGMALGTGHYLYPWLAAWFPNLLFGGLGIFLTCRIR